MWSACSLTMEKLLLCIITLQFFLQYISCHPTLDFAGTHKGSWEGEEKIELYQPGEECEETTPWEKKPWQPFRMKYFLVELFDFTEDSKNVIKELMNQTIDTFGKMLNVRRSEYPIAFRSENDCKGAGRHYGKYIRTNCDRTVGIPDADFAVFVMQYPNCGGGILASASHCRYFFGQRPMMAYINLCADAINTRNWNRMALLKTLQHELFHGLGFTRSYFGNLAYYENDEMMFGTKVIYRMWKINAIRQKIHQAELVASPKVQEVVREHFNCPDLEGAELENEGLDGTKGSHWEQRIFGGETMTGYISRRSYISKVTLAYFEDMGGYKPNYSYAEPFTFAKGAGCIFARGSCREYLESDERLMNVPAAAKPLCNWGDYVEKKRIKSTVRECSSDLQYYSSCDWTDKKTEDVDKDKEYFFDKWAIVDGVKISGRNVYGYSDVLDGCPQWIEYTYGDSAEKTGDSVCTNKFSQPPAAGNWGAELFGEDSICLKQDGKFEVYHCLAFGISLYRTEKGVHGAGCYRYKCENGRLMIQANYTLEDPDQGNFMRQYKICWGKGSVIQIRRHQKSGAGGKLRFHKGVIVCPDCRTLCENTERWGKDFKCAKDIRLNSTDYASIPCPQDAAVLPTCNFHWLPWLLAIILYLYHDIL